MGRVRVFTEEQREKRRVYGKAHYAANREARLAASRAAYHENVEAQRDRGRAYKTANREKHLQANAAYKAANKEKIAEKRRALRGQTAAQCKSWRKANPDRQASNHNATQGARRAAKLRATPSWLTAEHISEMKFLYRKAREVRYDVDHIVPLLGEEVCGLHVPWNLQILDPALNRSKGNKLLQPSVGGP